MMVTFVTFKARKSNESQHSPIVDISLFNLLGGWHFEYLEVVNINEWGRDGVLEYHGDVVIYLKCYFNFYYL